MKLNKIFALIATMALVLTACNEMPEREPSPDFPKDVKDVYFPNPDERGMEVDPSEGIYTYTVTIARKDTTGSLSVALTVIENTDSIFRVPAAVEFKDGKSTAEFEIDFTGAKDGVTYTLDVQVDLATVNPYTEGYSEYLFSVTPIKWIAAEKPAIFNDALFTGVYGVPGLYWYVSYEYAELGGGSVRYRFADVYSSIATDADAYGVYDGFPYNDPGDYDEDNVYYTIIDVDADGNASMPLHDIGVAWSYGEFSAGSTHLYLVEAGSAAADDYADGVAEEGLITFDAGDVYLYVIGYGPQPSQEVQYIYLDPELFYEANSSVKLSDYEDGFNDENIEWNDVSKLTTLYESELANGKSWEQKLYNAVDPNSVDSLNPESDFYNLYYLPNLYNDGFGLAFYYDTLTMKILLPQDAQPTGEYWASKEIYMQPSADAESYADSVVIGGAKFTVLHFMLSAVTEDEVIVADVEEVYYMSEGEIVWSADDYVGSYIMTGYTQFSNGDDAVMPVEIAKTKKGLAITGIDYTETINATVDAATGNMIIGVNQKIPQFTYQGTAYDCMWLTTNPDDDDDMESPMIFKVSMTGVISLHSSSLADGYLIYIVGLGYLDGYYDLVFTPVPAAAGAAKKFAKANNSVPTIMQQIKKHDANKRIDTRLFSNHGKAQRHPVLPGSLKTTYKF